jgi:hypothetical protein
MLIFFLYIWLKFTKFDFDSNYMHPDFFWCVCILIWKGGNTCTTPDTSRGFTHNYISGFLRSHIADGRANPCAMRTIPYGLKYAWCVRSSTRLANTEKDIAHCQHSWCSSHTIAVVEIVCNRFDMCHIFWAFRLLHAISYNGKYWSCL